jgi:hypothetical protein
VLLVIANRKAGRPSDAGHPFGYGREAYVWSLLAGVGVFVAGAAVSITYGIQQLLHPEAADDFVVAYVVLGISFILEGVSFVRSAAQAKRWADLMDRDLLEQVMATSDPTVRAVFAEDGAALVGLVIAGGRARRASGQRFTNARRGRIGAHRRVAGGGGDRAHQPESAVPRGRGR